MRFGQSLSCILLALLAATSACTRVAPKVQPARAQAAQPKAAAARETITRAEVIETAEAYANARWRCSEKNVDRRYNKMQPGMTYRGVAYNWGGWDTIAAYQQKIRNGAVAGTTREEVHPAFAGVDCSGFVSRCWGLTRRRYSTHTMDKISKQIAWDELKPGDIMNRAGHHVRLFEKYDPTDPDLVWVYEATGDRAGKYGVKVDPPRVIHRCVRKSVMMKEGYLPRRYLHIADGAAR